MRLKFVFLALFFSSLVFFSMMMFCELNFEKTARTFVNKKDELVIVLDPGHGGFDGGAVAKDGTVEKDINLKIATELKAILKEYPVRVVMTRTGDESLDSGKGSIKSRKQQDLKKRKEIIEDSDADLTISIHLNSYPEDESVYGAQVFYPRDEQKRTEQGKNEQTSKDYALNTQKSLEINISDGRERVAMAKGDILLFENPTNPIILVECGFLSNAVECNKLKTAKYQGLLAQAIWDGINTSLKVEKKQKMQVIHSTNKSL